MLDQLLAFVAVFAWGWFALVVVLITVRAFQAGGPADAMRAFFSTRVMLALAVALFLTLLSASLVFIEPQEVGVVVSVISPNGYREQPLRSGLRFIVPLAEQVVRYPIYWQVYTMSKEPSEGSKVGDDSISARTSDGQIVYLDSSVIYRIDANDAVRLHIELQNRYIEEFMRPVMRGVIRTEVSQFTADEINSSKRKDLENSLQDQFRTIFSEKGFVLDRFLLRNISFSPQYAAAVEAKQVAEQDRIQREYQAEQMRKLAEGERDKQRIEAEGRAAAILVEANAQATAIAVKRQALQNDPAILQYEYISRLSPNIQVMLVPNNAPFLLPLPDLTPNASGPYSTLTGTLTSTLSIQPVLPASTPAPTATPAP